MKILKYNQIETSHEDDFLYCKLIDLFQQVKLIQGGNGLAYTLRNHPILKNYCTAKQFEALHDFENHYFMPDGSIIYDSISEHNLRKSRLQNN